MTVHLPRLPFGLDPLVKEAKRRMRRRRLLLALALAAAAAVAVALTATLQPSGPGTSRSGGGTSAQAALPKDRLIVLDRSIGPVRLGEPRRSVERALGRGTEVAKHNRAGAYYFGRRLLVTYGDHGTLRPYVMSISTSWTGFHTASGLRVGASGNSLRPDPHLTCMKNYDASAIARWPSYGYCISTWAWREMYVLHHAEPSPQTVVSFKHGVITGFGIQ
jgi:hypothetical protein